MKFIKGKIYTVREPHNNNIFMWGGSDASHYIGGSRSNYSTSGGNFMNCIAKEAPWEDQQWLLECMKRKKFIPFKELKLIKAYEIY